MAKTHSQYICQQCGYSQVGWAGRCPNCDTWGSLAETIVEKKSKVKGPRSKVGIKKPVSLSKISSKRTSRISTKISELDRVLGGGLVEGQAVLLAGEPGIGKSTLLLQVADKLSKKNSPFLYVSGEESVGQIKIRANRLGIKNPSLKLSEDIDIDSIIDTIATFKRSTFKGVVIDSIQTMTTGDLSGMAGSVGQVRESAYRVVRVAKENGFPVILVGHVTKEGTVAGPAVLAHMVDTVLWFEGDKRLTLRILRAVKNRFGATDEVGIFSMEDRGLISQSNPEKIFLTKGEKQVAGSSIASIMEGTRPILVEVQSLVVKSNLAYPRRVAQGFDAKRLELLLAVLTKRCGLPLYEYDCFINIAGGIRVGEPAADLAVCMSIASSFFDKALPKGTIAIGEVGLLGDVREVVGQEQRIKEARRIGYTKPITYKQVKFVNQAIRTYLR